MEFSIDCILSFLSLTPVSSFCILMLYLQPGYNPPPQHANTCNFPQVLRFCSGVYLIVLFYWHVMSYLEVYVTEHWAWLWEVCWTEYTWGQHNMPCSASDCTLGHKAFSCAVTILSLWCVCQLPWAPFTETFIHTKSQVLEEWEARDVSFPCGLASTTHPSFSVEHHYNRDHGQLWLILLWIFDPWRFYICTNI